MEKLRREYLKEKKIAHASLAGIVVERIKRPAIVETPAGFKKMIVDPQKLEDAIKKACVPVQKRGVQILEKPPPPPTTVRAVAVTKVTALCKAINLNGTPCKCRANVGKFCAKHAP